MFANNRVIRLARQERKSYIFNARQSMAQHERRGRFAMAIHRRWNAVMNEQVTGY